jgi:hypothetical protein
MAAPYVFAEVESRFGPLRPGRYSRSAGMGAAVVLMAPGTGLGRLRDFRISNYQLMMQLIDAFPIKPSWY